MLSDNSNMGRIRPLPSGVANHVRASQVIGSIERGVEELLQNSIIHGAAKSVAVTMGTKLDDDHIIVVEDDGIGIDNDSMRMLVGTEACSYDASTVFGDQGRGESLRSISALCVMVKIESTYKSKQGNISSTKIIKNGVTVSFEDSSHGPTSSSIIPNVRSIQKNNRTGTRISLHNMFQQFAVRRKHHHSKDLLATVRKMMSMLALVYPLVSFKLVNGETGMVDSMLDANQFNFSGPLTCRVPQHHGLSVTLKDEANALVERMDKTDTDAGRHRSIQLTGEDGNSFRAFGVIVIHDDETVCRGRMLQLQLQVAVNGRPAAQAKQIAEVMQDQITKLVGGNSYTTAVFVHIVAKDSQLIIKDSTAMESVSNLGRMSKFLATMIARAADDNPSAEFKRNSTHADSTDNDTSHSRIVQGQYITAKAAADIRGQLTFQQSYQLQSSPFSNIFCETSRPPNRTEGTEDIKSNISFDDAFLDESTTIKDMDVSHSYDDMDEAMPSISWTRNRIKAINSVTELAPSGTQIDKIAFTKEMLASAEVVSQVDYSFIIIKMGSLICAVDQHAADERISLEALEKALFHHDSHDAMTVSLTKRQLHVGDILKSSPVAPSKSCLLTSTQMITARHHQTLLHKWKFSFEESSTDERIIILRGLPSVCGRVAQVEDMLEFLNDLGLVGGSSTKPKFVSRVLASNACRYAIMFGDRLSVPQCENVIESLSKCQQPYQCAHGRPSIIPLTHMSQGWANEQTAGRSNQDQADTNNNLEHYQKWGPKRVIRHQKSRTN